ncbi:hypothetical protein [Kocuria rosea]|uniref:restriction endonuclease subunit S n=1 Tax=Kocuria rosea TaxID=1275 RepID=UPI0012F9131A|nr:hypothetical protein [Kocuria polaris]
MYRFRTNDQFDPEFLELWLLSPVAQKQIDQMKTGISDSGLNLTQSRFLRLPVPKPTLVEQRQIVCRVQQHMISMEAALATVRHAKVQTNIWRASAINNRIFSGESWGHLALKDLLREPMRNGRSDRVSMDSASSTRCLTLTAVTQSQFSEENTKLTSTPPEVAANLWLEPGDVLVQRSNTPELVGTTARYDGPRNWAIFPDLLIRIRCNESIIDSRFLATVMRTERVHRFFRSRAKGLSGSMPKIDQDTVGITRIPVPPMDVQRDIIAATAEITDRANETTQTLERTERRAESLRNSVLVAAFEGRLTHERQLIRGSDNSFSQNLDLVSEVL